MEQKTMSSPVPAAGTDIELAAQGCEFCDELADAASSRFGRIYRGVLASRVVHASANFVVMPTLGQLFRGSLLLLPRRHFETVAGMPARYREELVELLPCLEQELQPLGAPVVFEHGAKAHTGRSCGIYHAHLHIVPVPRPVLAADIMPPGAQFTSDVRLALRAVARADSYLFFKDTAGLTGYALEGAPCGSQYFRRELVKHFRLNSSWDWRDYTSPEPDLLASVNRFADARGPVG
jgi:diadenosine tetraphosphate (Ap4A) HIT family hydrolase